MEPRTTSSMLGWDAAVIETVSPSQLKPAVIQRMSISEIAGCDGNFWAAAVVASAILVPSCRDALVLTGETILSRSAIHGRHPFVAERRDCRSLLWPRP